MSAPALLADIGGTNVRFALVEPETQNIHNLQSFACAEFGSIVDAVRYYLGSQVVQSAAFAVAAPISGGDVYLTNSAWRFNILGVRRELGLRHLAVVNDFTATALAIPSLAPSDLLSIGAGQAMNYSPIGVIGPGTGLGVSALIPLSDGSYKALESEGGHVTMAATDELEAQVLTVLRQQFGHVSAERVISGQGLSNLHSALALIAKTGDAGLAPDQITARGLANDCPICVQALDVFFAMLGTIAGNLALTVGAKGGVVLAGGILPRMTDALLASRFRSQFEAKGRFCPWLATVPTSLILHPDPAVIGLRGLI